MYSSGNTCCITTAVMMQCHNQCDLACLKLVMVCVRAVGTACALGFSDRAYWPQTNYTTHSAAELSASQTGGCWGKDLPLLITPTAIHAYVTDVLQMSSLTRLRLMNISLIQHLCLFFVWLLFFIHITPYLLVDLFAKHDEQTHGNSQTKSSHLNGDKLLLKFSTMGTFLSEHF